MNTFPKMFLSGANKVIEEKKHLRRESSSSALALFPQEAQGMARGHRYTEEKTTAGSLSRDLSWNYLHGYILNVWLHVKL